MIKAIVVDDERLVRKGIISMVDWSAQGIDIIGEAANGKSALDMLRTLEIDLLITDITMPGMSGFELIQQVNVMPRRIWTVVLTCHHEFNYVQEALRLGAIDYLVKTLLDMENFEETVGRIVDRIHTEEKYLLERQSETHSKNHSEHSGIVFCSLDEAPPGSELLQQPFIRKHRIVEIADDVWFLPLRQPYSYDDLVKIIDDMVLRRWCAVFVSGLDGKPIEQVTRLLVKCIKNMVFYTFRPETILMRIAYADLEQQFGGKKTSAVEACLSNWMQFTWTINKAEWSMLMEETEDIHPEYDQIHLVIKRIVSDWEEVFHWHTAAPQLAATMKRIRFWYEWKGWSAEYAAHIQLKTYELSVTTEVMSSLVRSIRLMQMNLGFDLNQEAVAKEVNMSRSYFSQCFKKLVKESFGDYLRALRVKQAKNLLEFSDMAIYEIAASVGFSDDKYFSRVFREKAGMLPTEYRMARKRKWFDEG
ncbi:response regulator [Paenibacillus sp. LMG 31461]|uniref:Response regulator n=1 Tax=Paenibacillus plantarum TaxID=2654975 RepID=A0ABX1X7K7_9BACL|nr:response regulator [Paenibacillus plantarum]NOU63980.1 response regulator [Paenibacillus plantarum]